MSSLHCVKVSDCHWQSMTHISLIREDCLSNRTEITREILIQVTDWIDLDTSVKVLSDKWLNLWHWSQIILNSGNWERSSSKTILYNLSWAIPSSAMGVLSSYPFPSQLFLSFHHFLLAGDIFLMDRIRQMFRKLTQKGIRSDYPLFTNWMLMFTYC